MRSKIREITVTIGHGAQVSPHSFRLSKELNQEVFWKGPRDQYFTVDFGNDSPFYERQFSSDYPYSGLVRRDVLGDPKKRYKYTVRIARSKQDPDGIIQR